MSLRMFMEVTLMSWKEQNDHKSLLLILVNSCDFWGRRSLNSLSFLRDYPEIFLH
jgi:hypothetical protein